MLIFFLYGNFKLKEKNYIYFKIIKFASDEGIAKISLFNAETSFFNKVFKGKMVQIKDQEAVAVFTNIPDGTYAISVFHDKNEDEKLNTFLGIPTENYAASNNAPSQFGPPKWKDAKFRIKLP